MTLRIVVCVIAGFFYFAGIGMRREVEDPTAVYLGHAAIAVALAMVYTVVFARRASRLRRRFPYSDRAVAIGLASISAFMLFAILNVVRLAFQDPSTAAVAWEVLGRMRGDAAVYLGLALTTSLTGLVTAAGIASQARWAGGAALITGWILAIFGMPIIAAGGIALWWWRLDRASYNASGAGVVEPISTVGPVSQT